MNASPDISPLAADEEAAAGAVITRSFLDDPLVSFMLRRRREETISLLFGALVRDALRHGCGWGARVGGRIVGVSVWLGPGKSPVSLPRHLRQASKWARLAAIDPTGLGRAMRAGDVLDGLHPKQPHWFLSIVAVDHDRRGTGTGRRLMEPGIAVAYAAGVPVHLDTSRRENLPIYERLGFEISAEVEPLPGSPTAWGMKAAPP